MEAAMTRQRHRPGRRLSLEVGFEPRRGGQEALTQAYERLLLALSRPVSLIPRRRSKDAHHATSDDTPDPNAPATTSGTGSHLRAFPLTSRLSGRRSPAKSAICWRGRPATAVTSAKSSAS